MGRSRRHEANEMPKKKVPKKKAAAADPDADPEEAAAEKGPVEPKKKKLSAKERRKLKEDERQAEWDAENGVGDTSVSLTLRSTKVSEFDPEEHIYAESVSLQIEPQLYILREAELNLRA